MFCIGQVVYSKCGRDKGRPFIVHHTDGEYLFLVDGDCHKLSKPKKKKSKHVQMTKDVKNAVKDKLENKLYLIDADIRKALILYKSLGSSNKEV